MGLVALLGRAGCEAAIGRDGGLAKEPAFTAGWQMRHWLPADPVLAGVIAGRLVKRGPLPGVHEEVYVTPRASWSTDALRRAGWTVMRAAAKGDSQIEIYSPDQQLVWSGRFRAEDFRGDEWVLFDTVVLSKVARGEVVAPFVPVGCVTELPQSAASARRG